MKILSKFKQNDILRRVAVNNIIVEELSKVIPQDEEYLRLVQRHKELSDYISKAIGGRNHADKVKGYTKGYTKILEEME